MSENVLCVTNRKACTEDFLRRIEKIAKANPAAILLWEKDLPEESYQVLAGKVMEICYTYDTRCILHNFPGAAKRLGAEALHLPLPVLRTLSQEERSQFSILGASCHSTTDAREAERLGCTYIMAGHIFDTDCKRGLPGRGLAFLKEVCGCVSIPVYAIGGISPSAYGAVRAAGAKGACVMSGIMACENPAAYLAEFLDWKSKTEGGTR